MLETSVISYVFLYVRDLARSRTFYEAKLGLRIIAQDLNSVKYDAGDIIVMLNRASDDIVLPDKSPSDYLLVFHTPDIERTVAEMSGVEVGAINRYEVGGVAEVKDPDGHPLSFYEPSEKAMTLPSAERIRAILGADTPAGPKCAPRCVPGNKRASCELIYLFLFIRDAAEAREFYGEVLGLRSLKQSASLAGGASDGVVKYDGGGIILTTHHSKVLAKRSTSAVNKGIAAVFNVDDINHVVDALSSRGLKFDSKVRSTDIGKVVQFRDPNNHRFFLHEPPAAAWRVQSDERISLYTEHKPSAHGG